MFHTFGLRFVAMLLVLLAQVILTLLSAANIVVGQLTGSFVMLPAFIIATNAPMCIALLVLMILDWRRKSPISVQSEVILCAAAGGMDLISAVGILYFKSRDAICDARLDDGFWNLCGAHFAIVSLLWTATFLLFSYAIALFYTAWRYSGLHPFAENSIWTQTVKGTHWTREASSPGNAPGRRLRKQCPMDIESLRRVVKDEDSRPIPRQTGPISTSFRPSATYPRPLARPPRIDSPVGFAERMGYFRRDAYGGYIPSTPNASREMLPANPPRARSEEIRGAVFTIQTPQPRRPSYPDLPNPFSPRRVAQDASAQPSPNSLAAASSSRSRSSSNSSARSGESNPGFAGVGAGSSPQKSNLRISVPMLLLPPQRQDLVPLSAMLARTPTGSGLLGMDSQQPLQVSTPTASGSARPALPPRQLLQAPQPVITPTSPHLRQAGARPGYNSTHQPSRSHPSLSATVSTMSALESAYGFNPMTPRHDRPKSQFVPNEVARPQSSFLQVPPPTMSPSTRQRLSNVAYPLPLPPLSTYPIKSIALSAQQPPHSNPTESATTRTSAVADAPAPAPSPAPSERSVRERPLSVVSSASAYSTSSASHGPVPPREIFGPPGSALPAEDRTTTQQSNAAPSRRPSKSKNAPTLSRGLSQHGMNSQNRWGGTGNGPTRRSLAAQFRQPQAGSVRRS